MAEHLFYKQKVWVLSLKKNQIVCNMKYLILNLERSCQSRPHWPWETNELIYYTVVHVCPLRASWGGYIEHNELDPAIYQGETHIIVDLSCLSFPISDPSNPKKFVSWDQTTWMHSVIMQTEGQHWGGRSCKAVLTEKLGDLVLFLFFSAAHPPNLQGY